MVSGRLDFSSWLPLERHVSQEKIKDISKRWMKTSTWWQELTCMIDVGNHKKNVWDIVGMHWNYPGIQVIQEKKNTMQKPFEKKAPLEKV